MIGQTLEKHTPVVSGAAWWFLTAMVCLAIALFSREVGWGVLAILPATLGLAFLLTQEREFHAELRPQELIVNSLHQTIGYSEIREIWYAGTDARAVYVVHSQGILRIPKTARFSATEIYAFLAQMLPRRLNQQIHPAINHYFQSHLKTFRRGASLGAQRSGKIVCHGRATTNVGGLCDFRNRGALVHCLRVAAERWLGRRRNSDGTVHVFSVRAAGFTFESRTRREALATIEPRDWPRRFSACARRLNGRTALARSAKHPATRSRSGGKAADRIAGRRGSNQYL